MDKEKQKQFHIASTLNLSEQSPLIPQEHPNQFARMPTIFAGNKRVSAQPVMINSDTLSSSMAFNQHSQ